MIFLQVTISNAGDPCLGHSDNLSSSVLNFVLSVFSWSPE